MVKNTLASAGAASLIQGLGRPPGEGDVAHSSILAWKIPWTEESGELQAVVHGGHKRVGQYLVTN